MTIGQNIHENGVLYTQVNEANKTSPTLSNLIYFLHRYKIALFTVLTALLCYIIVTDMSSPEGIYLYAYRYPDQSPDLWKALDAGVHDVNQLQRPSTFILLYQPQAEDTIGPLLKDVTEYMSRVLKKNKEPTIVSSETLNSPPFSEDYGEIIHKFGSELKDTGILVVTNLENLSGQSAQAFHAICDEYSPLVETAVIIFTVKVQEFPKDDFQYLRSLLQRQWINLDEDIFEPLFTRITSMALRVNASENVVPYSIFQYKNSLFFSAMLLTIVIGGYYLLSPHGELYKLMNKYPEFSKNIWDSLFDIDKNDQLFLITDNAEFKEDVIDYLMEYERCHSARLNENNMESSEEGISNIKVRFGMTWTLLVVEKIENLSEELLRMYKSKRSFVTKILQNKTWLLYTVESRECFDRPLEEFLDNEFLALIPSRRVLRAY